MSQQSDSQCQENLDAAIECLVHCLWSREGSIRQSVRRCLVSMGTLSVPSLIQALSSDNREARWEAAKALGQIRDPRAAGPLVYTLSHDHFAIRWLAAEALIALRRQSLEPLLNALLRDPDSGFLRDGAHHVLHSLAEADPPLRGILDPLVDALGAPDASRDIIPPTEAALEAIRGEAEQAQNRVDDNRAGEL